MRKQKVLCDDCGIDLFYFIESGKGNLLKTSIDENTEVLCLKCYEKVIQ